MTERCSVCGSGIRSHCAKAQGRVVCRDCCLGVDRLDALNCRWRELSVATELRRWGW